MLKVVIGHVPLNALNVEREAFFAHLVLSAYPFRSISLADAQLFLWEVISNPTIIQREKVNLLVSNLVIGEIEDGLSKLVRGVADQNPVELNLKFVKLTQNGTLQNDSYSRDKWGIYAP